MKHWGFKIELNTIITHYNISELKDIYDYACELGLVGVKVFTVNDFGGRNSIATEDFLSSQLNMLIQEMLEKKRIYPYSQMFLNSVGGIRMELFSNKPSTEKGCILKIVDHQRGGECMTPDRVYGQKCKDCMYYKEKICSTGLMSLTMRAFQNCKRERQEDTRRSL